ncbi:MAG: prepilin-type N-terminal cleavage/methylation domain-containing protein [Bdellovibrionales bacterium]|nr:prepilin-type N-terminal cleavage/methylation domain-containing protein [Bdellovibrionales bacterium]
MKRFNLTSVSNDRGFTLIEILIAITIMAFMTMGVVSITQNAADTMDRTTVLNKNNLQIETALSRFEWDFSQIYSPLYFSTVLNLGSADQLGSSNDRDMDGRDDNTGKQIPAAAPLSPQLQEYYQRLVQRFESNQHFGSVSREGLPIPRFYSPDKTVFEFFTSSNRRKMENTKQSHFGWVRYSLGEAIKRDDDEEKSAEIPQGLKTLVRYYSADDPYDDKRIDPEDDEHVKAAVLLENVESLEFQFWDMTSRKWESNLKAVPGAENAVRGVRLIVTWYDSTGFKRSVSRIYRNHWPMEVPQDTVAPPAAGGTSTGNTAAGGDEGGDEGGNDGGNT